MEKIMGYSVSASVCYGADITDWVESGNILSSDDIIDDNVPDFGFEEVSLQYVHAEYIGYKFYLEAEDWFEGTEDINARDFGETIGAGTLPNEEILSKMNRNIEDALTKIADYYGTDIDELGFDLNISAGIIIKASFG